MVKGVQAGGGAAEIRMVENVKELTPELQFEALGRVELAMQGEVDLASTETAQRNFGRGCYNWVEIGDQK